MNDVLKNESFPPCCFRSGGGARRSLDNGQMFARPGSPAAQRAEWAACGWGFHTWLPHAPRLPSWSWRRTGQGAGGKAVEQDGDPLEEEGLEEVDQEQRPSLLLPLWALRAAVSTQKIPDDPRGSLRRICSLPQAWMAWSGCGQQLVQARYSGARAQGGGRFGSRAAQEPHAPHLVRPGAQLRRDWYCGRQGCAGIRAPGAKTNTYMVKSPFS